MTFATAVFRRWLRLALALAAGLLALLATTQVRRLLASDRAWPLAADPRLVREACTALAIVLLVAACTAAIEVVARLRREGALATMCMGRAGLRRLLAVALAMAGVVGGGIAVAASVAMAQPEAAVLQRGAAGWEWRPWPSVEAMAIALASPTAGEPPAAAVAAAAAWAAPLAGGLAGAFAVAACVAFAATVRRGGRLLPHFVALDALALAAALWCAAPAAALAALALAVLLAWRRLFACGVRRSAG